ncbi:MAG: ion channel [Pseudomonadota bacterium]
MTKAESRRRVRTNPGRDFGFQFAKIGASRFDLRDPYHLALSVPWPAFAAAVFALYGLITTLFAVLYLAQDGCVANARPGSIADAFFFSIETLATVGYGEMAPATFYGHLVASAEIICGMAFTAIMTGLVFVRFSKPRARIIYADNPVITRYNGVPTLMIRIGNGRMTMLTDTHLRLSALIREMTREGRDYRRVHHLRITPSMAQMFPLTLTVMHQIDPESPLSGLDVAGLADSDIRFLLSVEARDPGLAAVVHDLKAYAGPDIRLGMHYADLITQGDDGRILADLTRISVIEPDDVAGEGVG